MNVNRLTWLLFLVLLAGGCGQRSKPTTATAPNHAGTNDWKSRASDIVFNKKESFEAVKGKAEKGDAHFPKTPHRQ
jgi:hypothetical protein